MAQPSNREQLVEGAIKCLQTKGYANTTARDITTASGANLASIGYHFGSKEALLNEAMIRLFSRRNWRVGKKTKAASNATPLARLRAMFTAVDDVFKAPRPLFVSFVEAIAAAGRSNELRAQLAAHYRDARHAIADTVSSMSATGGASTEEDEVTAVLLMALFDGLALQWLLDPAAMPKVDKLVDALVRITSPALAPTPGAPTATARRRVPRPARASRG